MKSLSKVEGGSGSSRTDIRRENLLELVQTTVASLKSGGITVSGNNVEACIDHWNLQSHRESCHHALDVQKDGPVSVEVGGDGLAFIKVADGGCGMTAGFIRNISFLHLRQPRARVGHRTYHSRQIVEAHHGRIESKASWQRSVFTVWIPTREISRSYGRFNVWMLGHCPRCRLKIHAYCY